jgi:hypothetical protein
MQIGLDAEMPGQQFVRTRRRIHQHRLAAVLFREPGRVTAARRAADQGEPRRIDCRDLRFDCFDRAIR